MNQISLIPMLDEKNIEEIQKQAEVIKEYDRAKRRWENAFQKWSNEQAKDERTSTGICDWGSICDWCYDNSYGRPCVRALNAMCREKRIRIDYTDFDFEKVWYGKE